MQVFARCGRAISPARTPTFCKVTVALSDKAKGSPKPHTVKLTVSQGSKVTFEQVRDARVLSPGARVLLFVIPC